jgi:hypothetical protein
MKGIREVADALATIDAHEASVSHRREFRSYEPEPLVPGSIPLFLQELHTTYLRADALAFYFQKKTFNSLTWLFLLGFLIAMAFEFYAHILPLAFPSVPRRPRVAAGTLVVYLLLWAWIGWRYWRSQRNRYQDRFRSYRALAEGLRLQFFGCSSDQGADQPEFGPETPSHPVRHCRYLAEPRLEPQTNAEERAAASRLALEHWIVGQARYFHGAVDTEERKRKCLRRFENVCLWVALGVAVVLMLAYLFGMLLPGWADWAQEQHPLFLEIAHAVTVVMVARLLVTAGLFHGYAEKRAYGEHVESYRRTARIFDYYKREIQTALVHLDSDKARKGFRDLGREALRENTDWVRLHRWRPLEVPLG